MNNGTNTLIVDINPQKSYSLKTCLWQLQCSVHEFDRESEAMSHIITQRPKIIFVSLEFAKLNGFDFLNKVKELHDCTLIVYTDKISRQDLDLCIEASVDQVLLNPCDQMDRLRRIVS